MKKALTFLAAAASAALLVVGDVASLSLRAEPAREDVGLSALMRQSRPGL